MLLRAVRVSSHTRPAPAAATWPGQPPCSPPSGPSRFTCGGDIPPFLTLFRPCRSSVTMATPAMESREGVMPWRAKRTGSCRSSMPQSTPSMAWPCVVAITGLRPVSARPGSRCLAPRTQPKRRHAGRSDSVASSLRDQRDGMQVGRTVSHHLFETDHCAVCSPAGCSVVCVLALAENAIGPDAMYPHQLVQVGCRTQLKRRHVGRLDSVASSL